MEDFVIGGGHGGKKQKNGSGFGRNKSTKPNVRRSYSQASPIGPVTSLAAS